jgi:ADP-ribose pyrophosphatase YjhB (NUDIX family)
MTESDSNDNLLPAKDDAYGGVIIDDSQLPHDSAEFSERLGLSLTAWRARGVRGVWLKLPLALASHVGPAVASHGFGYHHAEPGYAMLTRWLPLEDGVESGLPPNASHQVGVGALVVDARRGLVLAVQERTGPLRGKNVWKLPTGLVHAGEDLHTAAEREVEEETGVRARFAGVLAVRQAHGFAFGKSDLFFLCALVADDGGGGGGGGGGGKEAERGGAAGGDAAAQKAAPGGPAAEQQPNDAGGAAALGPPQAVVACEREIERAAWLTVDDYEREQSKFNGHLPLYSQLLRRSIRYARAAVEEAAAAAGGGGGDETGAGGKKPATTAAAAAVSAAVATARRMGLRGSVLDGGIWKPRTDLLLWADDEGGDDEDEEGGKAAPAKL